MFLPLHGVFHEAEGEEVDIDGRLQHDVLYHQQLHHRWGDSLGRRRREGGREDRRKRGRGGGGGGGRRGREARRKEGGSGGRKNVATACTYL